MAYSVMTGLRGESSRTACIVPICPECSRFVPSLISKYSMELQPLS